MNIKKATFDEFVDWAIGEIVISIGKGNFHSVAWQMLELATRWEKEHSKNKRGS